MNFYYDPILGLQYDYLGDFYRINFINLPEVNIEDMLKLLSEMGVMVVDSSPKVEIEQVLNITEYKIR